MYVEDLCTKLQSKRSETDSRLTKEYEKMTLANVKTGTFMITIASDYSTTIPATVESLI